MKATIELPAGGIVVQAAPPSHVSQTNCACIGFEGRKGQRIFLGTVRDYRAAGHPVADVGRLRVVERVPFVAWLFERQEHAERTQPESADDAAERLASELGIRLVSGGAK